MAGAEPRPGDDAPRWAHYMYAKVMGYFWFPCPLCGQMFGGHEWRDIDGKVSSIPRAGQPNTGRAICPSCTRAGRGHVAERVSVQPDPADHPDSTERPAQ